MSEFLHGRREAGYRPDVCSTFCRHTVLGFVPSTHEITHEPKETTLRCWRCNFVRAGFSVRRLQPGVCRRRGLSLRSCRRQVLLRPEQDRARPRHRIRSACDTGNGFAASRRNQQECSAQKIPREQTRQFRDSGCEVAARRRQRPSHWSPQAKAISHFVVAETSALASATTLGETARICARSAPQKSRAR